MSAAQDIDRAVPDLAAPDRPARGQERAGRLLIGVTGGIGIVYLPQQLNALSQVGLDVRVVMSPAAEQMLPASTVACFASTSTDSSPAPGHIALARWPDLVVVLPCTANTLGQLAHGLANTLLATVLVAHRQPVMVFPAMNEDMWASAAVQRNVTTAQGDGHIVVAPRERQVYEVARRKVVSGIAPPAVEEIVQLVVGELARRGGGRDHDAS